MHPYAEGAILDVAWVPAQPALLAVVCAAQVVPSDYMLTTTTFIRTHFLDPPHFLRV